MTENNIPTLSICISTLNRASFIGETLRSIVPQLSSEVEIVVVDGASTDNTSEVVGAFAADCPYVRYVRLPTNSGADADFDNAVMHARGRWCWLMTDDDLLMSGAVEAVMQGIRAGHDLIIVNAEVRNADFSRLLERSRLPLASDRTFGPDEWNEFAALAGAYLSFIAGVVIRREVWMGRQRTPYYGSLFIHIGVIFQQPLAGTVLVLAQPYISIRYGNAMWRPREFEVWMFKWPDLIWSFPGLSDAAKGAICPRNPWKLWSRVLFYRAKGTLSLTEYRTWVRPTGASLIDRLPALVAACFPGRVANLIALAACGLFRARSGMRILDLRTSRFYIFRRN